jgi:hypothetical protein
MPLQLKRRTSDNLQSSLGSSPSSNPNSLRDSDPLDFSSIGSESNNEDIESLKATITDLQQQLEEEKQKNAKLVRSMVISLIRIRQRSYKLLTFVYKSYLHSEINL